MPIPDLLDPCDLAGCGAVGLAALPSPFHGAACIVQASAQHGRKPGLRLRLRLWVWLSRPTWGAELARWLKPYPCDRSVFAAVQPIYTAAPIMAAGVADPMPARLLLLTGRDVVDVPPPAALAPPPVTTPERSAFVATEAHANRYVRAALERGASNIANAGEGNRHRLIVAETCRLARFVAPGLLTGEVIGQVIRRAAQHAGKDDEAELDAAIAYGLENPWTAGPMPGEARNG